MKICDYIGCNEKPVGTIGYTHLLDKNETESFDFCGKHFPEMVLIIKKRKMGDRE